MFHNSLSQALQCGRMSSPADELANSPDRSPVGAILEVVKEVKEVAMEVKEAAMEETILEVVREEGKVERPVNQVSLSSLTFCFLLHQHPLPIFPQDCLYLQGDADQD